MGGKSYFCDYCECYMKNDINIRKTHNSGLAHTIAKTAYMKQFEDPKTVYEEELAKTPCRRYFKGMCKFSLHCQYSHYNSKQLNKLKKLVDRLKKKQSRKDNRTRKMAKSFTHVYASYVPWLKYDDHNVKNKRLQNKCNIKLPPSLKSINFNKNLPNLNSNFYKWG